MDMQGRASALEQACNAFISSYSDALPRIAMRGLQPILAAAESLSELLTNRNDILIFRYPLDESGKRSEDESSTRWAIVVWLKEEKSFGWTVRAYVKVAPNMVFEGGLPGYRQVTIEDLVELKVRPVEIAEFLKSQASAVGFSEAQSQATQPTAKA
jgi:hypothetical protein